MSLVVWLPLTKDLRQQGLSNVTVTNNGATFNSAGKLGGCYAPNGLILTNLGDLKVYPMTIAFWCKTTNTGTPNWEQIVFIDDTSNSKIHGVYVADAARLKYEYNPSINANSVNPKEWHHYAFIINNGDSKVYVDGILNSSSSEAVTADIIGRLRIGTTSTIQLNDFRIYDHCLSPMEVKELAKGLVLHYPLNRQGWGQENLHKNSDTITSTWSVNQGIVSNGIATITPTTSSDRRIYQMPANGGWTWQSGKTYTASIDAKSPNGAILVFYPYGAGSMSQSYTITSEWKRYNFTFTATQSSTASMTYHVNQTSGVSLQLKCPKLEEGSIATPWCPNSSDVLATTMGLNGATEYDCSGFCNNGTRTGTFSWTSDCPKYNVSTQFNGTQHIRMPFSCGAISEAVSIAVWGYENNWNTSSAERLIGAATGSSGWCIGDYGSENTLFAFYANGDYNTAAGFKQLSAGWHHFVITFDGLHLNYYVDGQSFSSKTFSTKQVAKGNYNIEIGRHYGDGCNFKGRMSDVRIYATALSADDVKSLYQNSAYIDSSGNVYGAIHTEV